MQIKDAAVKERPILMSAPMVQSLLSGQKNQTRRVMKPQPEPFAAKDVPGEFWHIPYAGWPDGRIRHDHMGAMLEHLCPYGKIGDRLWVRETFFCNSLDYPEPTGHAREHLYYRASPEDSHTHDCEGEMIIGWKPSIFMPRWASRLTLEITNIRVERVQSITESDIFAEGVGPDPAEIDGWEEAYSVHKDFRRLWDSINEKRGFGWQRNPWVWCLSFKRVEEAEQ